MFNSVTANGRPSFRGLEFKKDGEFSGMANIFLLEDDRILSRGISIALKKDEHTVTAVYGYAEALLQYQTQ